MKQLLLIEIIGMIHYITGSNSLIKFENVITPSILSLTRTLGMTSATVLGVDLETTGKHPMYNKPLLLGIKIGLTKEKYIVDLTTIPRERIIELLNIMSKFKIVAHNASFDLSILYYHFNILFKDVWCTQVAEQVLFNGVDSFKFGYAALVTRYFKKYLDKSAVESFIDRDTSLPFTLTELTYLANDIEYLIPLFNKQQLQVNDKELTEVVNLEMRFLPNKVKMEFSGVEINKDAWLKIAKEKKALLSETEKLMRVELKNLDNKFSFIKKLPTYNTSAQLDLFNDDPADLQDININAINLNSPAQLLIILNECGGSFQSTGIEVLHQKLRDNKDEPYAKFLELLVEYRGLGKAVSTYGETFLEKLNKVTGRLHSNFTQVFTTTGRLSSSSYEVSKNVTEGVNLQNIIAEKQYRNCFIAGKGRKFITADYGGQEIALAAWQSKDPLLLAAVRDGLDIHSKLATESFRIINNDPELIVSKTINPQYRKIHKNVLFGLFYGAGAPRVADILNINIDTAYTVYQLLRKLLYKLMEYQDKIKSDILTKYSVRDHSYTNRVRYFEKLFDGSMSLHKAEKEASNFPIQSSGASMIKLAICELFEYFEEHNIDAWVSFTVHDEIIANVPEDISVEMQQRVIEIMKHAAIPFIGDLPIEVEAVTLPYWTK